MRRLILWIPAPVGIFAIMFLGLLLLIVVGIPLFALMAAGGAVMIGALIYALLAIVGIITGKPGSVMAFFVGVGVAAAMLTLSGCLFYYGEKLLKVGRRRPRYALALRDQSFNG